MTDVGRQAWGTASDDDLGMDESPWIELGMIDGMLEEAEPPTSCSASSSVPADSAASSNSTSVPNQARGPLDGEWKDASGLVGTVVGETLIWRHPLDEENGTTRLGYDELVADEATVWMDFLGERLFGTHKGDEILWTSGDIWHRVLSESDELQPTMAWEELHTRRIDACTVDACLDTRCNLAAWLAAEEAPAPEDLLLQAPPPPRRRAPHQRPPERFFEQARRLRLAQLHEAPSAPRVPVPRKVSHRRPQERVDFAAVPMLLQPVRRKSGNGWSVYRPPRQDKPLGSVESVSMQLPAYAYSGEPYRRAPKSSGYLGSWAKAAAPGSTTEPTPHLFFDSDEYTGDLHLEGALSDTEFGDVWAPSFEPFGQWHSAFPDIAKDWRQQNGRSEDSSAGEESLGQRAGKLRPLHELEADFARRR